MPLGVEVVSCDEKVSAVTHHADRVALTSTRPLFSSCGGVDMVERCRVSCAMRRPDIEESNRRSVRLRGVLTERVGQRVQRSRADFNRLHKLTYID